MTKVTSAVALLKRVKPILAIPSSPRKRGPRASEVHLPPRPAAVPHLRALRHRPAPAERGPTAVASRVRAPRGKDARLVAARARQAQPIFFDDRTNAPRSTPHVLSPSERASVYE